MNRRRTLRWTPALAAATLVLVLSVVRGGGVGPTVGPLGVPLDKWLHAVGYAGLALLVAAAHGRAEWSALAAVVGLVVVYGGLIELLQGALPWRSPSVLDLLADAVGAVVGVAVYRAWWALTRRVGWLPRPV